MTQQDQQPSVLLDRQGNVAIITLNRPEKLNTLGQDTVHDLKAIVDGLEDDGATRVAVLTGKGRGFCSGVDLSRVAQPSAQPRLSSLVWPRPRPEFYPTFILRNANFPVVGAINGVAAGAGLSLALACDLRIASEMARFACVFVKRGLMPDFGLTYTMTKAVGSQKALEIMLTGATLDAQEALRLGLVLSGVPQERLMDSGLELAERRAKGPAIAIAQTKRAVYRAESSSLDQDLETGSYAQQRCMSSDDAREGAKAFFEKRDPSFKGQ